ncbi:hypothetical protein DLJ82_6702 (plasmid) [Rhizobium leguminosarum]|uniref:Uncharacterized protein n=1 Tax=Rhizobium leguminosarum TaxID=384 RepID=A0A2Z4YW33_RHILE|nr:hypothetical protein DLJ82_6702 [Rhizobium leguminosarum]
MGLAPLGAVTTSSRECFVEDDPNVSLCLAVLTVSTIYPDGG